MIATATASPGCVRITFDQATKREPVLIWSREEAYHLAVQLCEAVQRAWPESVPQR